MEEQQYLDLIKRVIDQGTEETTRNGTTLCTFGEMMRFSLLNNKIPFLTSKQLAWKTCLKELLWFISGSTNNDILRDQNVHIWDGNCDDHINKLKSRNIQTNSGELGPIYGHQWRHFNAQYINNTTDYNNKGVDQLKYIINMLKNPETRTSRRLVLSAWNPCQLDEMALPPCHVLCQFHVSQNNRLHCALYQRSGDIGLGVPFNIASYAFLTHIIAQICNLQAFEFVHIIGNAHIYIEHKDALLEQIERKTYEFPDIEFTHKIDNIDDVQFDHIKVHNYQHSGKVNMKMKV